MENRFEKHIIAGKAFRTAIKALGLNMIPVSGNVSANTLSAVYYPEGVTGGDLLGSISEAGVIVAGGLLSEIKTEYFRVGHMGSINHSDLLATIGAIEAGLMQCNYNFESGTGLKAAQDILNSA